jgi:hypothetical protein
MVIFSTSHYSFVHLRSTGRNSRFVTSVVWILKLYLVCHMSSDICLYFESAEGVSYGGLKKQILKQFKISRFILT